MRIIRTLFVFLMSLVVAIPAWAESINESQARAIASRFMASRAVPSTSIKMAHKAPRLGSTAGDKAAYYVFNGNDGYVIVAGDDSAPAILGYSERGSFDAQDLPEAMQDLLESYVEQIAAISQGARAAQRLASRNAIAPLVHATWSQNNPYNILFPYVPNGKHAVVGCVATAMAQVMYYWQWPQEPTQTIPAYTSSTLNIDMSALSPVTFNWNAMRDTYETSDTTSIEAQAAATLSLYCAQSVEMDFLESSSAAYTAEIPAALSTYFDYNPGAHVLNRCNYTSQEWADVLYSELVARRPVIYAGSKMTGGHAFICDGYDGNGMFHINWGWNGKSNGYFLLNVLNPEEQGTGSASGTFGYILSQRAVVGIKPRGEEGNVFELTSVDVSLDDYTGVRSFNSDPFTAIVSGRFYNYTSDVMAVRLGWGLYQGETMVSKLYSAYNLNLHPSRNIYHKRKELEFGANMTSGTYRILPIYSEYGQDNWRPCAGADKNYIEVAIDGNSCTFTGHGTAGERDYTVNDITMTGNMHNGRPVDINVGLTNNGQSSNEILYMLANGTYVAAGFVGLEQGETGDIPFKFMPSSSGQYNLVWAWNEDGSNPIASRDLTINAMPAASLSATARVLNITDATNKIIVGDKFSVEFTITNNGNTTYDEDISVKLLKHTQGNSGSTVQAKSQHLVLAPGATTVMRFDMDNVIDGWQFYAWSYYYSEGEQVQLKGTAAYTIHFPEEPEVIPGDVNDDGIVTIKDVTALIDYLLGGSPDDVNIANADVDGNGTISIKDVTALIDILLS